MTDSLVVVAAATVPLPKSPSDSVPAVMLGTRPDEKVWRLDPDAGEGPLMIRPRPVLRFSSLVLIRDVVLADACAGILPEGIAGPGIGSGALVR